MESSDFELVTAPDIDESYREDTLTSREINREVSILTKKVVIRGHAQQRSELSNGRRSVAVICSTRRRV